MDTSWIDRFAATISNSLKELHRSLRDTTISMLSIDCHPWSAALYLAILQNAESQIEPELANPSEMASWQLYDCGSSLAAWDSARSLAEEMWEEYERADDKGLIAEAYLSACAEACHSTQVQNAFTVFRLSSDFRINVSHPDDEREFYIF